MGKSDSGDCVGNCGLKRKADNHRAQLSVDSTTARNEGVAKPTELETRNRCCRGELHLAPSDGQQFLEVEQRPEDRYDWVDDTLVSVAGMTKNGENTRLSSAHCELRSRAWVQKRRVQAQVCGV